VRLVLERAAATNGRTLPALDTSPAPRTTSASPLDLFRPLPILARSAVMFFNWTVGGL
jgi:hypothetical protein